MSLSAIFAEVKARFVELVPELACAWDDGGEFVHENAAPARVVFVPTEDDYGPSEIHDDAGYRLAQSPARPLATCKASVQFRLWGHDRDETERLRDVLVSALRRSVGAAYEIRTGYWLGPERTVMQGGRVYVLVVAFHIPVLEVGGTNATVTTTDTADTAFDPHPGP